MGYPAGVIDVLELDGNLANTGSGANTYSEVGTVPFSTSVKKYGTHAEGRMLGNGNAAEIASLGFTCKTIQFFFYFPTGMGTNRYVMYNANRGTCWIDGGKLKVYNGSAYTTAFNHTPDTWHLCQITFDGTDMKIYIDEALFYSGANTGYPLTGKWVWFNHESYNNYYDGYVDRIVLCNYAADGSEISPTSAPTISSVDPAIGSGFGGTSVNINGTGFLAGATIDFDGTPATNEVVVSDILITCNTSAHAAGLVGVTITNTDTGTYTLPNAFEYVFPTITNVYPARGSTLGGRRVVITGTGFLAGATIDFDGTLAKNIIINSPTEIECDTPARAAGLVNVTITNTDTSTGTMIDAFEYYLITTLTSLKRNSLLLNKKDITKHQPEKLLLNEELNIIESWDFNFSGIDFKLPLKLNKYLLENSENVIEVKNEKDVLVYTGKVFKKSVDTQTGYYNINSFPFIDALSTTVGLYAQTVAQNGIVILRDLIQEFLPPLYLIDKAVKVKSLLKNIDLYIDTDGSEENVMSIALSLCELLQTGIYFEGLEIKFFPVISFPNAAADIAPYLIEGHKPIIDELPDLYFDKLYFIYKNDKTAEEEGITAGTGDVVKEYSVPSYIYMSDTVAALIAQRHLEIGMKKYNSFSCGVKRNSPLALSQYFTYETIIGTFLGVITKKEFEGNQIKITGIGEWL